MLMVNVLRVENSMGKLRSVYCIHIFGTLNMLYNFKFEQARSVIVSPGRGGGYIFLSRAFSSGYEL